MVAQVPPAQQNAAALEQDPQEEPDPPVLNERHAPERVPKAQPPQQEPDPPVLAQQHNLARVPDDGLATQRQPDHDPPHPDEPQAQKDAAHVAQGAQKQRWQYLVVTLPFDGNQATARLNGLELDGWEYLGLINTSIPGVGVTDATSNSIQATPGHESSVVLRRPKVLFNVRGAIEGESLKITTKSGDFVLRPEHMTYWVLGKWSGDRQLHGQSRNIGDWADLELPAPAEGKYHVVVYLTKSPGYGIIQFHVNGTKLGKPIDTFHADTVGSTGAIDLGTVNLKMGTNSLGVEVTGTNPKSAGLRYEWGLDCVVLKQAKEPRKKD